ncbi:MAG: hypothetical protein JHC87_00545 [Thermoleophilaceae bacterium]|nr:hypothetical protein [Thermoleophilaceae bacterium]
MSARAPHPKKRVGEPSSFAWTEPIVQELKEPVKAVVAKPQVVVIGRGPSVTERLALAAPGTSVIASGAALLLVALAGLALMSPSSPSASATRSSSPYGGGAARPESAVADATIAAIKPLQDAKAKAPSTRDPFADPNYAAKQKIAKLQAKRAKAARQEAGVAADRAAKTAAIPDFIGNFVYYSSYTPWERVRGVPDGWIDFEGQPTLKVQSVTASGADLYVVSDVDVVAKAGKGFDYSYPLRKLHVKPGAVVRFADYRDIEGEDVTYTLRFRGSSKNPKKR